MLMLTFIGVLLGVLSGGFAGLVIGGLLGSCEAVETG